MIKWPLAKHGTDSTQNIEVSEKHPLINKNSNNSILCHNDIHVTTTFKQQRGAL